jgi:glycosyltransferase involved in cell wall biosynthesis
VGVRTKQLAAGRISLLDAMTDGLLFLENIGFSMGIDNSKEPLFLVDYPIAIGNPFQALYHCQNIEYGIIATGTNSLEDFSSLKWPVNTCLHIHWLGNIIGNTSNEDIANNRLMYFFELLDKIIDTGIKILWTVHNILPHDSKCVEQQIELRKGLIERCDVIHIMNEATPELVSKHYQIPDSKIIYSPHCSYENYYPDITSRIDARYQLGLKPKSFVFLFFGSIQPYKGLENLIDAFKLVESTTDFEIELLISGKATTKEQESSLLSLIADDENIHYYQQKIPIDDVQYHFRAANVCVCSYKATLNSGVAHLSHSFEVPVIGPNIGGFQELLEKGGGLLFELSNQESLINTMKEALYLDEGKLVDEIRRLNVEYNPKIISMDFSEKLLAKLNLRNNE